MYIYCYRKIKKIIWGYSLIKEVKKFMFLIIFGFIDY
jgi:hypothetical protein